MSNKFTTPIKKEKKKLTNFNIIERQDINGKDYYIIFDQDNQSGNNAYFCWSDSVKEIVKKLQNQGYQNKEIAIEYQQGEKGKRITDISTDVGDIFVY